MLYTILSVDYGSGEPNLTQLLSSIIVHQFVESYDQAKNAVREVALRIVEEELGRKRMETCFKEHSTKLKHLEDGLYLMECKEKPDTIEMYQVKTNVSKGWVYNAYLKEVKRIRIFTVISSEVGLPVSGNLIMNNPTHLVKRGSEQEHGVHVKLIEELRSILEQRNKSVEDKSVDDIDAVKNIEDYFKNKPKKNVEFKRIMDKNASPLQMKGNMLKELESHFKAANESF